MRSRAPKRIANRTNPKLEALVLRVRERLQANPWAQVGAAAIAWELAKLHLRQLPESRTIERILERAGVRRRERRSRYAAKGTPYPATRAVGPNELQEADLVGPRHLAGAIPFYVLNVVDVGRRAAALELQPDKSDAATAAALIQIWSRLGIPTRLKLDNWLIAHAAAHALPATVWLCLAAGVIPVFVPFREPWRQGIVEHFNDTFDKRFFRAERFRDLGHLVRRLGHFERFHNTHHRYAALGRATPEEFARRLGFVPRLLDPHVAVPGERPRRGRVEFIRLIRSDRLLQVLGEQILLGPEVVHEYVTAILHVRRGTLEVVHGRRVVKLVDFPVRD